MAASIVCNEHNRLRLAPVYRQLCRLYNDCVVIAQFDCTACKARPVYVLAILLPNCVDCVVTFQVAIYTHAKTAFSVF